MGGGVMVESDQAKRFTRNTGLITAEQQDAIARTTVGIAGCGGDGGQVAEALARNGYSRFLLADPEDFELENLNRQCAAEEGICRNKAETIAARLRRINPATKVTVYAHGVQPDNVEDFVAQSDIIIDESDYTVPLVGIGIARAARAANKVVVMGLNVGYGGVVTSFVPGDQSLERRLGFSETETLEAIQERLTQMDLPLWRWIPALPTYLDLGVFAKVVAGELEAPSVVQGVLQCATMTSAEVHRHVTGVGRPHVSPCYQWIDAYQGVHRRIRRGGWLSFHLSLLRLLVSLKLGWRANR
jgi:molybdopterin/thiamine biosynthesis adenylyltransferase